MTINTTDYSFILVSLKNKRDLAGLALSSNKWGIPQFLLEKQEKMWAKHTCSNPKVGFLLSLEFIFDENEVQSSPQLEKEFENRFYSSNFERVTDLKLSNSAFDELVWDWVLWNLSNSSWEGLLPCEEEDCKFWEFIRHFEYGCFEITLKLGLQEFEHFLVFSDLHQKQVEIEKAVSSLPSI